MTSRSVSGSNLVVITRERRGVSLWEETTEISPSIPVAGRRYTLSWLTRAAVRAAEQRLGANPTARLEIHVSRALDEHIDKRDGIADAFMERWGAAISIVLSEKLGERDFELIER